MHAKSVKTKREITFFLRRVTISISSYNTYFFSLEFEYYNRNEKWQKETESMYAICEMVLTYTLHMCR